MFSPQSSQRLIYATAALSAFAIYKHTSICVNDIFPVLDRSLGPDDAVTFSAKSNFLQVSAAFATIGTQNLLRFISVYVPLETLLSPR
jgi:hypothetical protein